MASAIAVTEDDNQHSDHAMDTPDEKSNRGSRQPMSRPISPSGKPAIWVHEASSKEQLEEDKSVQSDSFSRQADVNPGYTMTVVSSRRNANGTVGSVYSGNKIRHLKKDDGIPLWRKDIQYTFLRAVFEDDTKVFTLVDGSKGHSFADIYIDAMARSSKTSRVLKDKLLSDKQSAINMAMICLLVNVGRMNTTLNFFPEMRAQLRTYHSIPCLQKNQEPNSQYKGLQDAPRLKSILKGSCEDTDQPNTIEKIQKKKVPRTNPVNLIFVLSQQAPKISEQHFFPPRDFFDLVIRSTLSSKSRAKAFLWLVWWYLESDYTKESALSNPFGPGLPNEDPLDPDDPYIKVPNFEHLTEEQANAENVDTEEEKAYGEKMRLQRKKILEDDETGPQLKRSVAHLLTESHNASPARSEAGRTRSPSPSGTPTLNPPRPRKNLAAKSEDFFNSDKPARLILKAPRNSGVSVDRGVDTSSPAPPGGGVLLGAPTPHTRRSRTETSHQRAVNQNRKMRIDKILQAQLSGVRKQVLKRQKKINLAPSYRLLKRLCYLPDGYDSEEDGSFGAGGLVPNSSLSEDIEEDFGAEALKWQKVVQRAVRRLNRQEGFIEPHCPKIIQEEPLAEPSPPVPSGRSRRGGLGVGRGRGGRRRSAQPVHRIPTLVEERTGTLDDLDLDLLGEGEGEGEGQLEVEAELGGAEDDTMMDAEINDIGEVGGGNESDMGMVLGKESDDETDEAELTEDDFFNADPYATVPAAA